MYLIWYNLLNRKCYIIFYTRNNIVEITFIINNFKLLIINLNIFVIQLLSCKKKLSTGLIKDLYQHNMSKTSFNILFH